MRDTIGNQRIECERAASTVLRLKDGNGHAMAEATVSVRQTRHHFLFGCNAFMLNPKDDTAEQRACP